MNSPQTRQAWLQNAIQNLSYEGFAISENGNCSSGTLVAVARRERLELTKCGFTDTFVVFREFDSIDYDELKRFSSDAFEFAKVAGRFARTFCYAVAIATHVEEMASYDVRNEEPPRHWMSAEIPVIYDEANGRLLYFEKTPLWGLFYYSGFRSLIRRNLAYATMA
jgi:hypothetical protein